MRVHSCSIVPALVLCLTLFASAAAYADTVTFTATADAEMDQFSPNVNAGTGTSAVSGALGTPANHEIRRASIRFDLTGKIPSGAVIESATVKVQVVRVPQAPGNSTFDLRRVLQAWSEGAVTWNTRLSASTPWQTPGAIGAQDSAGGASSSVFVSGAGAYTFPSSAGLVADVQSWVDNPASNFGWLLISEDEASLRTARHFATRESGGNAPVLTVTFSAAPLSILEQPKSQTVTAGSTVNFSVIASGAAPITYQWQFGISEIPDATNSILTLNNVTTNDAGAYTVTVHSANGSTNCNPAILTVEPVILPPPIASFVTPTNGQRFPSGSDVDVLVNASASNAVIRQVELSMGTNLLAILTNSPYHFVISNVPDGNYQLSALALDSNGSTNTTVVGLTVIAASSIGITSPSDGQRFALGTNVLLGAQVSGGATISEVRWFAGVSNIADVSSAPYEFNWTPTAAGDYALTAIALDEFGRQATSAPVAIRVFVPENMQPTIAITSGPKNFSRLRSTTVTIAGTASDNVGLDRVEAQVNGGGFETLSGTTQWSGAIQLAAGPDTIQVHSVDLAGNVSATATRFYTLVVQAPVAVRISGQGSVRPNLDGELLEIGRTYRMKAKPDSGQIFAGWDGVPSQGALLLFRMESNLVVTANFIPNPFLEAGGSYTGLIMNTNAPAFDGTGTFDLRVTKSGAFSARFVLGGTRYSAHGEFDPSGKTKVAVLRPSMNPIAITLSLDLTNGTGTVSGTATDGSWTSELSGTRTDSNANSPSVQPGESSIALEQTNGVNARIANVAIWLGNRNRLSLSGTLFDGRGFHYETVADANGTSPILILLNKESAAIAGWLQSGSSAASTSEVLYWMPFDSAKPVGLLNAVPAAP